MYCMKQDPREYYPDWVFGTVFAVEAFFIISLVVGAMIFVA